MRLRNIWRRGTARLDAWSSNTFIFNPWRQIVPRQTTWMRRLLSPVIRLGLMAGFKNVDYAYVHGNPARLRLGERCSVMDTVFNVISGEILVGDDTLFSHGCQVLTGIHRFSGGRRVSLGPDSQSDEVPTAGRDIVIGSGCFFGAGSVVLGGVTIGDNCIIGAGAVVTQDVPAGSFAAGVPARVRGSS